MLFDNEGEIEKDIDQLIKEVSDACKSRDGQRIRGELSRLLHDHLPNIKKHVASLRSKVGTVEKALEGVKKEL